MRSAGSGNSALVGTSDMAIAALAFLAVRTTLLVLLRRGFFEMP